MTDAKQKAHGLITVLAEWDAERRKTDFPDLSAVARAAHAVIEAIPERGHADASTVTISADLIGLCPHGYLLCFYCWRDAGFPGGREAQ